MDEVLTVAEQLAREQDKVDAFIAEVGEETFAKSIVGQGKLRDIWMLRFLIGFKWKPKECAEKFKTMVRYRCAMGCDEIRAKLEAGTLSPGKFPGYREHHDGCEICVRVCTHSHARTHTSLYTCLHTGTCARWIYGAV
jgi:hypothetical protein